MPAYTTQQQVGTVISIDPGDVLTAYIDTAHQVVVDQLGSLGYTDAKYEIIERWLSAHYYACDKRRTASSGVAGGATQAFDPVATDLRLNSTHYGQTAIELDDSGTLSAFNNSLGTVKKLLPVQGVSIGWLGTPRHHHRH